MNLSDITGNGYIYACGGHQSERLHIFIWATSLCTVIYKYVDKILVTGSIYERG